MSVNQLNFNLVQVSAVLPWLFVWGFFPLFKDKWDFTGQQSLWCSPSSLAFSFLAVSVPALESYASLSFINHLFIFVLPLCWTCKISPPESLPASLIWCLCTLFFSSTTFDMMFSLATIIAYDLLCRAFSIIIFSLYSINRSSFAFCWWICFFTESFGIFSLVFLCFPCALLVNFLCAASARCLGWELDLLKSIKTATTGSRAILMWEHLNFSSLIIIIIPQSTGCFLSAVWVTQPCSADRHSWFLLRTSLGSQNPNITFGSFCQDWIQPPWPAATTAWLSYFHKRCDNICLWQLRGARALCWSSSFSSRTPIW